MSPVEVTWKFECNLCHRAPLPQELADDDSRPTGWIEISFRSFSGHDPEDVVLCPDCWPAAEKAMRPGPTPVSPSANLSKARNLLQRAKS